MSEREPKHWRIVGEFYVDPTFFPSEEDAYKMIRHRNVQAEAFFLPDSCNSFTEFEDVMREQDNLFILSMIEKFGDDWREELRKNL